MFADRRSAGRLLAQELLRHADTDGLWYEDFRQVHDEEVVRILEHAAQERPATAGDSP